MIMVYLNALNKINGIGSQKMKLLIDFFKTPENAWKANLENLKKSGIGEKLAEKMASERSGINPDKEWEKLQKENIKIITLPDENYPKLLKEIPNPPYTLYVKGNFNFNSQPLLAVVGSRKFTSYGKQAAFELCQGLVRAGVAVVSGLAFGIDAIAHQSSLEANGKTIAVLGNSLDEKNIAPRANFDLARRIVESEGTLISEFPIETTAAPGTFPARNRIMAGMTLGTLVIEAAQDSGSLITANLALEFNREVFAVPGSIFGSQSAGTNNLIKSGAKMVTGIKDILDELKLEQQKEIEKVRKIIPGNSEEEKILNILSGESLHIDNIIKLSKLKTATALSTISIMEMKGMVKNIGGQNYIIL